MIQQSHHQWTEQGGWQPELPASTFQPQLVFVFGALQQQRAIDELAACFDQAIITGCSSAGEIHNHKVFDDTLVVTALKFQSTSVALATQPLDQDSEVTGQLLAQQLPQAGLKHVFVFADGLGINGTALVNGMKQVLPDSIKISGGMAADGENFGKTLVCAGSTVASNLATAVGIYGDHIEIRCGSFGGWDPFGPDRIITESKGNRLYRLDNHNALALYKKYLGPHAADLPGSALRFPLFLHGHEGTDQVVRTVLAIDEQEQSLIFAGDVPQGSHARFMSANLNHLIDGATIAGEQTMKNASCSKPEFALLISCVGRRMVLRQMEEEEIEVLDEVYEHQVPHIGFYSYGEIAPLDGTGDCSLHNQTMTITTLCEHS